MQISQKRVEPRLTILFVSNDKDTLFYYQAFAVSEGVQAELASRAHEALLIANVLLPDVVVLDAAMNDDERVDIVWRLRQTSRTKAVPILIVDGDDNPEMGIQLDLGDRGGDDVKPLSIRALLNMVRALTAKHRVRILARPRTVH